jgi:hypothetical protein
MVSLIRDIICNFKMPILSLITPRRQFDHPNTFKMHDAYLIKPLFSEKADQAFEHKRNDLPSSPMIDSIPLRYYRSTAFLAATEGDRLLTLNCSIATGFTITFQES